MPKEVIKIYLTSSRGVYVAQYVVQGEMLYKACQCELKVCPWPAEAIQVCKTCPFCKK